MTARQLNIQADARQFSCIEWGPVVSGRVVALVSDARAPREWAAFAALISDNARVVAIPGDALGVLPQVLARLGGMLTVVAHGGACDIALRSEIAVRDRISGLVLADFDIGPTVSAVLAEQPLVRTMLLRGRQCARTTHAAAVMLHEALPGSRLIEPEDCGDWPFGSCPESCATAVKWFMSQTGSVEYFDLDGT